MQHAMRLSFNSIYFLIKMKQDYSKYIFDTFYQGGILKIYLKDGNVLEGKFIGHFHGDEERNEPFIIKWHFVIMESSDDIPGDPVLIQKNNPEIMIMTNDIVKVEFK